MRSLFTPALIAAFLSVPFAVHAQTKLDPTEQALLGGMAHASSVSAPALSPVNAATTPYGASDPLAAQTSPPYTGNGATGFGGTLGNGSLSIGSTQTSDTDGNITFKFNPSGTFNSNDVVIYIDSKADGFNDTSQFNDNGDDGRTAISGVSSNGRTQVNFASGFAADYAISFENSVYTGAYGLATGGNGSLKAIKAVDGGTNSVILKYTDLGLAPGQSFKFVGTLISTTAYRSDEAIGSINTVGNPGFGNPITFSNYDTYTPAPEPSGIVPLLMGASVLSGLIIKRRRAASATVTDTP